MNAIAHLTRVCVCVCVCVFVYLQGISIIVCLLGRAQRGLSVIEQTLRLSRAMFVCLYRRTDRSLGPVAGRIAVSSEVL